MTMHINSRFCIVVLFITIICCLILPNQGTAQNSHINSQRKTIDIARTERSRVTPLQSGPIIDDFQVNDNLGGCRQSHPSVEFDTYKNFVIAWQDNRNDNGDIYAQRYDQDGVALGENFRVNDDADNMHQYQPNIAVNASGNFVITWQDDREDYGDIFAQLYDYQGLLVGTNFKVNDDVGFFYQENPAVALNNQRKSMIVWTDYRNNQGNIFAQMFDNLGQPVGSNFKVNDDTGDNHQDYPAITTDGWDHYVVTWMDSRNGNPDIFAQMYDVNGNPIGQNFKVNTDVGDTQQYTPDIDFYASTSFVIAWVDERNVQPDIYAQKFDQNGVTIGDNKKVNDDVTGINHRNPSVATGGWGEYVVAWTDDRNSKREIFAQEYSAANNKDGPNYRVSGSSEDEHDLPCIAMDGVGKAIIVWEFGADRHIDSEIVAQRYQTDGSPIGNTIKINDDVGSAFQYVPVVAVDDQENFIIVWEDTRNDHTDIFAQRYDQDGQPLAGNFKVNDDDEDVYHQNVDIAVRPSGEFIITWQDKRNGNEDIFAQQYDKDGSALGPNFQVNDNTDVTDQMSPSVAMDAQGNFVIAWEDRRCDERDIFAQRYDSQGLPVGNNFRVNDDIGNHYQWTPSVAMDGSGNFIICWNDQRNNDDIYAQRYDANGSALGSNFRVNDEKEVLYFFHPVLTADDSGNFVIVWSEESENDYGIYAQRYDPSGAALDSNFRVSDDIGSRQYSPAIDVDEWGQFIVIWGDNRNGPDIYAQKYSENGNPLGDNSKITSTDGPWHFSPDVGLGKDKMIVTWSSNAAGGTGFDIWANVWEWTCPVYVDENRTDIGPETWFLHQNYPNPFNPETTIEFSIPEAGEVEVRIYNQNGEKVRLLTRKYFAAGMHRIIWKGRDDRGAVVPSGIYFIQIQSSRYSKTIKAILLR